MLKGGHVSTESITEFFFYSNSTLKMMSSLFCAHFLLITTFQKPGWSVGILIGLNRAFYCFYSFNLILKRSNGHVQTIIFVMSRKYVQNRLYIIFKYFQGHSYGNFIDPAINCADVVDNVPGAQNGMYFIKSKNGPKQVSIHLIFWQSSLVLAFF